MIAVLESKQALAPGLHSKQRLYRPFRPSQVPNNLLPTQPAKTAEHRYNHSNSNRSRRPRLAKGSKKRVGLSCTALR